MTFNIPQRTNNPFATCWIRPSALGYRFPTGDSVEQFVDNLAANRWRGQIVGPHGVGKSTLLGSLSSAIETLGRHPVRWTAGEPVSKLHHLLCDSRNVVLLDGWEQLSWWRRAAVLLAIRLTRCGLVATTHHRAWLPLLVELRPSEHEVLELFAELAARAPALVSTEEAKGCYQRCSGNVRAMWFELYDLYELRRRTVGRGVA